MKTKFYVFWTQTCRNWTELFTCTFYFSQVEHALKFANPAEENGGNNGASRTQSTTKNANNFVRSLHLLEPDIVGFCE